MGFIDFLVIGLYAAAVLAIGTAVGRRWPGADDFLLGDRRVPTGAVLLSLVATELSAATFVGVPADAYGKLAWTYLQFGIGSIFARIVLARWVVPLYHRRRVRTVYEFIGERFGTGARRGTAGTFLIGRLFASSVRLYIAAFAFSRVFGSGIEIAIIACGLIAAVYSIRGGIRAVIWTDALQGAVLLAGAVAVLATIAAQMPGGLTGVFEWARGSEAIGWLSFDRPATGDSASAGDWLSLILRHDRHVITAVVGGFVLTLATHSTDHDMVQRLLTTKTGRQGGIALALSGFVNVPVVILFLSIGTGLAALAASGGGAPADADSAFPTFVREQMASPWRGLVLAGLFAAAMSSLDSAICAIGATWAVDLAGSDRDGDEALADRSRRSTLHFAGLLILGAIGFAEFERRFPNPELSLVTIALSSMTIVYGGLLGVFGCGFLTRRGNSRGAVTALVMGGVLGVVLFLQKMLFGSVPIAWPWWIPITATVSCAIACSFPPDGGGEVARADLR